MTVWELIGAVVGAGLASGREIAAFFAQYGKWSYAGIFLAVGTLVFLAGTELPRAWHGRMPERIWRCLQTLMLIITGGAMISAAGEVAALITPAYGAYRVGMLMTLLLAWFLACRSQTGLSVVSRMLLAVLGILLCLGFMIPPMRGVPVITKDNSAVFLRAAAYGGFNAALQWPLLHESNSRKKDRALVAAGLIILAMLLLGNGLLCRHPALLAEPMPFLKMMQPFGKFGYVLCALSLYLAVLSTLTACVRAQKGRILSLICMLLISLVGFSGVVEMIYPLVGICCTIMLIAAKIMNSSARPFLSRKDML